MALASRRQLRQQGFQRLARERLHVGLAVRAAGLQGENMRAWPIDADAGMAGRVAVAIAAWTGRSRFLQTPSRAMLLAHFAREQGRIGFAGRAQAGHGLIADR